jgi:hypothetical protein
MTDSHTRIIDQGWLKEFADAGKLKVPDLLITAPFIKLGAVRHLKSGATQIRVLTRFSLNDFVEGVSDIDALRHLLKAGAEVRGIKNLHAKLYVFGTQRAILTSANLTLAALTRNHELGLVTENPELVKPCRGYFDQLWHAASRHSKPLSSEMLDTWKKKIEPAIIAKSEHSVRFADYGTDLGFLPDPPVPSVEPQISVQAFVKFFGTSQSRADRSALILTEVENSESNWALSYPKAKRPRQVKTGNVMFIGRMVRSPNDIRIYGRAIAYQHQPGRDEASAEDKKRQPWKEKWSSYIRVRDPEFILGTLQNGISLNEMMDELGEKSFVSTESNALRGEGNTNPRIALRSKAHMPLSQTAADWVNTRFYRALSQHGRISAAQLENLYSQELPVA